MSTPATINLFQARATETPTEVFARLAEQCVSLGVTASDVYGDNAASAATSSLRTFEAEVASYLGKEDAMFLPSGVMAQNIVLAIAKKNERHSFLCHHTSHLLLHEQNSFKELLNMTCWEVGSEEKELKSRDAMRFEQLLTTVHEHLQTFRSSDTAASLPGVLFLECPHREVGGKATPLEEVIQMSEWCQKHHVHFHMDGARLWEALAHYPHNITQYFDSLYVSFYKGLGGLSGAMLVGKREYIQEARIWLRRFGGNLFTLLPYHVSCWNGFRNYGSFENGVHFVRRKEYLQSVVLAITNALKEDAVVHNNSKPLIRFDPPVPTVSLVHIYVKTFHFSPLTVSEIHHQHATDVDVFLQHEAKKLHFHVQEALEKVATDTNIRCLSQVLRTRWARKTSVSVDKSLLIYAELNMGPSNMEIPVDVWVKGFVALQQALREI